MVERRCVEKRRGLKRKHKEEHEEEVEDKKEDEVRKAIVATSHRCHCAKPVLLSSRRAI